MQQLPCSLILNTPAIARRLEGTLESLRAEAARMQQPAASLQQPAALHSAPADQTSKDLSRAPEAAESKARDLEAAAEREQRLQETVAGLEAAKAELEGALTQERDRLRTLQSEHEQAVSGHRGLETEKNDLASSLQV